MSVPAGHSAFGHNGDSTRARSCPSDRLATHQGARSRCVRSMSATQHSTNEHPYSPAPGSSSGLAACVHRMGCAHPDRGIERFTTPESLWWIARLRRGLFLAPRDSPAFAFASCGDQPLTPLSRPPRSARMRCLPRCAPAKVAKIASTPFAVTRSKLSRPRVPSLGKRPVTHCDHFRSPIRDRRRHRDVARRASDSRLLFTHDIPPERLRAPRGFLW